MKAKARFLCLLTAVATAAMTSVGASETRYTKRIEATADGAVFVSNIAGTVSVRGADAAEVVIDGTLGPRVEGVEVTTKEKRTEIVVKYPRRGDRTGGADLTIEVPRNSSVEVETVSASAAVKDVAGIVRATSVSGDVEVTGPAREVECESVSGNVVVSVQAARVRAESVSGDVTVRGARSDVSASTTSGDVSVNGSELEHGRCTSISGRIHFEGSLIGDGSFKLSSHSGDVTLLLPVETSADFSLETFSGDIDNQLGAKGGRHDDGGPGKEVRFSLGSGGAKVSATSFSGDVHVLARTAKGS
ncbi:MAG: DUF4097 family beta strand repeat protein [Candidatus Schekmanbacteria bacterium]|nr:DUF4097 family beta strand repeat protein [Candidatus Schekmanbacteria bacterium]